MPKLKCNFKLILGASLVLEQRKDNNQNTLTWLENLLNLTLRKSLYSLKVSETRFLTPFSYLNNIQHIFQFVSSL